MSDKIRIIVNLDKELLRVIDDQVIKLKIKDRYNYSRSAFITESVDLLLRKKVGIPYILGLGKKYYKEVTA